MRVHFPLRAAAIAAAWCALAAGPAAATTITLDLNSLPTGTFTSALNIDGFALTPAGGASSTPTIVNVGGTNALESSAVSAQGADVLLTMIGGGPFTLDSVQVAAVNGDTGVYGDYVVEVSTVTGFAYGTYACGDLLGNETCGGV